MIIDDAGRIAEVGATAPAGATGVAAPGFVDLQNNGFAGVDFRTADPEDYALVARALAATGTTTVLPTFFSASVERYVAALGVLAEVRRGAPSGTRLGGAHLEGPFLSRVWAGAHDTECLVPGDERVVARLVAAGPPAVMTVAPEVAGRALEALHGLGVVVSMGHTDATADQARDAVDRGVTMITHCFNAHRRFTPRDPGPAGVAVTDARVTVGLVCDLVHLAPETVLLAFGAARGRVAIVTDAVAPAGTSAPGWDLDGARVTVADGSARLDDGTLAGSVCAMDAAVRNVISLGVAPADALGAASTVPARTIGLDHSLRPGRVADLVVLDDGWNVTSTLVGGAEVHHR